MTDIPRKCAARFPRNRPKNMPPTTQRQPPTQEQISARAHRYYQEAGSPDGRDDEFWFRAERDLQEEYNRETQNAQARRNETSRKG